MGGRVLLEGCPDADMDLVWRGRVELAAVDGVLPDTSVRLEGGVGEREREKEKKGEREKDRETEREIIHDQGQTFDR